MVVTLAGALALACSDRPGRDPDGGVGPQEPTGPFLATGRNHSCAVFSGGAVRCWGENTTGQLGRPPLGDPLAEYSVDLGWGRRAMGVYAGLDHTCAVLFDGEGDGVGGAVKCWGLNTFGQLGLGDRINRGDGTTAMGSSLPEVDLGRGLRAVALAPGDSATCALLESGLVKCWGESAQGALGYGDIAPRGISPGSMGDNLPTVDLGSKDGTPFKAKSIASVDYHSFCAILRDPSPETSGLKCWGSNDFCELGLGSEGGRGAEPGMMGNNLEWVDVGTTASGGKRKAVAMAGGFQFMCVLGDDGAVVCWGANTSGQLGVGTIGVPRSCVPAETGNAGLVQLPRPAVAIGARGSSDGGGAHACALLDTRQVTCWGENSRGQLGTGDTQSLTVPSPPFTFPDGFVPERLVLGSQHSCAISAEQRVKCWGSNQQGQLGPPAAADLTAPGPSLRLAGRAVSALAVGHDHACAVLKDGALKCWGRNREGQLGLGDTVNRGDMEGQMGDKLSEVDLGGSGVRATAVAAGRAHSCAVLGDGEVKCWGVGLSGQLGLDQTPLLLAPSERVPLTDKASTVAAGADFSCALLVNGQVHCWGENDAGQLGNGDHEPRSRPAAVPLGGKATAIVAGERHACALLATKAVKCWGANASGQLGVGDSVERATPAPVALGSSGAIAIAAGGDNTCALVNANANGSAIKCWGANENGQLGLGDATPRSAPTAIPVDLGTGRVATGVEVGAGFACAVLSEGQLKCWGDNRARQLGISYEAPAYGDDPDEMGDFLATVFVGGGRTVKAISAGVGYACALLDTDDVRCWGDNSNGKLGVGDAEAHTFYSRPTTAVDLGGAL